MASAIEFHPEFATDSNPTSVVSVADAPDGRRQATSSELIDVGRAFLRRHPAIFLAPAVGVAGGIGLAMLVVALTPAGQIVQPF